MDDNDFNIPYIVDIDPNYPLGHQLPDQAKKNVWTVEVDDDKPITTKEALKGFNCNHPNKENQNPISVYVK